MGGKGVEGVGDEDEVLKEEEGVLWFWLWR